MSFRTSQATKAILTAWTREQELVKEGKGTRDWTTVQQQDILERGRAYDDDGKAFEGQHMKSVESYPEYQSNPDNIQFLTRDEHLAAHDGSWLNPTNWYYDPITKEKTKFAEDELIPCKTIELSEPVMIPKHDDADTCPSTRKINNDKRDELNANKGNNSNNNITSTFADIDREQRWQTYLAEEKKRREQNPFLRIYDHYVKPSLMKFVNAFKDDSSTFNVIVRTGIDIAIDAHEMTKEIREESLSHEKSDHKDTSYDDNDSKHKKSDNNTLTDDPDKSHDGTSKSPHIRHEHLTHVWTGPKNGERVKEERWIEEIHVNGDQEEDDE